MCAEFRCNLFKILVSTALSMHLEILQYGDHFCLAMIITEMNCSSLVSLNYYTYKYLTCYQSIKLNKWWDILRLIIEIQVTEILMWTSIEIATPETPATTPRPRSRTLSGSW